jgi:hypothetical protein
MVIFCLLSNLEGIFILSFKIYSILLVISLVKLIVHIESRIQNLKFCLSINSKVFLQVVLYYGFPHIVKFKHILGPL